ncbi:MAG TPA: hypothetical protein VKA59_07195 [Vicinamibacterales bacterium]|nr:hypothetical protein [Vicinamibacterales bacterium]
MQTPAATRVEAVNQTGTDLRDGGIEVSGPIVQNRLFFFAAADPQMERQSLSRLKDSRCVLKVEQTRERNIIAYLTKLTGQKGEGKPQTPNSKAASYLPILFSLEFGV